MSQKLVQWIIQKLLLKGLDYVAKYLPHLILEWKRKKEREIEQAKALKEYNEVIKDDGSTKEERMKAHEKFLNSGN